MIAALVTVWTGAACAGDEAGLVPAATDLDCEVHGYPCTWGEVAPAVLDSTENVAEVAMTMLENGAAVAEVAAAISRRADAGIVLHDDYFVRFWLRGGRPVWVASPEAARLGLSAVPAAMPTQQVAGPTDAVGSAPSDRKPRKSLLFLDPYRWEFAMGRADGLSEKEADVILEIFADKRVRDYKCPSEAGGHCPCEARDLEHNVCMDWIANDWEDGCNGRDPGCDVVSSVTLDHFRDWQRYDVIHVSSHGTELCDDQTPRNCAAAIATGVVLTNDLRTLLEKRAEDRYERGLGPDRRREAAFLDPKQIGIELVKTPRAQICKDPSLKQDDSAWREGLCDLGLFGTAWREYVGLDFFKDAYKPGDLQDKLIFLNSCVSLADGSLARYLAGSSDNAVIGWKKYVANSVSSRAAALFYRNWLDGKTAHRSFRALLEVPEFVAGLDPAFEGRKDILRGEVDLPSQPETGPPGMDGAEGKRGVEVVFLLDPETEAELPDGGRLPLAGGAPGDGQEDVVDGLIEVIGMEPGEEPGPLSVRVDGRAARRTYRPNESIGDTIFRYRGEIELDFDLPERPVDLEVRTELPGSGHSRWLYEDLRVLGCWWQASIEGVGTVSGSSAHVRVGSGSGLMGGAPTWRNTWIGEGDRDELPPEGPFLHINLLYRPEDPGSISDITEFTLIMPAPSEGESRSYGRTWGVLRTGGRQYRGNADFLRRDVMGMPGGTAIGHLLTTDVAISVYEPDRVEGTFRGSFLDLQDVPLGERGGPPEIGIHRFPQAVEASGTFRLIPGECR